MNVLAVLNVITIILLILGVLFTVLGLVPVTRAQVPYAFGAGITLLTLGFGMLVVLLVLGPAGWET